MKALNPERLLDLVLLRLSVPARTGLSPADVARSLHGYVASHFTPAEWSQRVRSLLDEAVRTELATHRPRALTSKGAARVTALLGIDTVPPAKNWRELKTRHLRGLAAGKAGTRRTARPEELYAAVVLPRLVPDALAGAPAGKVLDEWLRRRLGLSGKVTVNTIKAALLAQELGVPRREHLDEVLRFAAVKLTGARRAEPEAVSQALIERWLEQGDGAATAEGVSAAAPGASAATAPAASVAGTVRSSATNGDHGGKPPEDAVTWLLPRLKAAAPRVKRFGDRKLFIGSAWEALKDEPRIAALGIDGFKDVLVEAHRRGELELSRADLVAAMDPADVATSETRHLNATYHFIQLGMES